MISASCRCRARIPADEEIRNAQDPDRPARPRSQSRHGADARSAGAARVRIKVISVDGGYEDKCSVTVYSELPVESIAFKNEKETIYLGYTLDLDTVVTPENALFEDPIWTSSNEEVATVENGIVTALKIGSTTITVSDESGEILSTTFTL